MEASRAVHVRAGEGRSFWGPGDRYPSLVPGEESGGSMFALDCIVGAGGGPPPHRHLEEDELFYVFDGTLSFTAGEEARTVSPGESVFVPRGITHSYRNVGEADVRMIAVYTPAGMEGWFREVCTPVDDPSAAPPPVTPELIERMLEAGPRMTGRRRDTGRRTDREGVRRLQVGWEFVHIAIDDCTRLAYAEVLPDERATTAIAFLRRALAFYRRHGIQVERLLTDNGSAYRATVHAIACRALGIRHLRTRPHRPQTNGKAERFIRTMLSGWAYAALYRTSTDRARALDGWLWHYNHERLHSALGHKPPIARLRERNNLLGTYTAGIAMAFNPIE